MQGVESQQIAGMEGLVDTAMDLAMTWGLKIVGAIVVLIIGRMVAGWVRRALRKGLEGAEVDPTLIPFLSKLAYYFMLIVVVIAVLGVFGVQTASLVAVLGAAGLAVGLALQGTLSNFAAGVMLLIFRPFKLGDFVDVAGTSGTVEIIGVFATILRSPDNVRIVVPNSQVSGATIKNFNGYDTRRVDMVVGISYNDDIPQAMEIVTDIIAADPRVLAEPAPVVAVSNLGDSSVDLVIRPWCAGSDYWALRWDLNQRIKEGLEAAGCSIPFPQTEIHLKQQTA